MMLRVEMSSFVRQLGKIMGQLFVCITLDFTAHFLKSVFRPKIIHKGKNSKIGERGQEDLDVHFVPVYTFYGISQILTEFGAGGGCEHGRNDRCMAVVGENTRRSYVTIYTFIISCKIYNPLMTTFLCFAELGCVCACRLHRQKILWYHPHHARIVFTAGVS